MFASYGSVAVPRTSESPATVDGEAAESDTVAVALGSWPPSSVIVTVTADGAPAS